MSDSSEKSHVLTTDVITVDAGRCEAGMMLNEGDVNPSTWQWLLDRNFVRSVESIEAEADADDEQENENPVEQPTEEVATDTQPTEEVVESTVVTEEPKQAGRRTRRS